MPIPQTVIQVVYGPMETRVLWKGSIGHNRDWRSSESDSIQKGCEVTVYDSNALILYQYVGEQPTKDRDIPVASFSGNGGHPTKLTATVTKATQQTRQYTRSSYFPDVHATQALSPFELGPEARGKAYGNRLADVETNFHEAELAETLEELCQALHAHGAEGFDVGARYSVPDRDLTPPGKVTVPLCEEHVPEIEGPQAMGKDA
ncbi:hypothetical protein DFH08DRAFT_816651 [Mycena albidolilacea]|uniref:Uncharacterized protein n=1 Tax=Mycena albidolilacea TaxID=1033008 RepID=A0AAD6ZK18_9AGAR|nr:hypothetical protein DFH08DRAFT_816651 [Mycena albidolilacea]